MPNILGYLWKYIREENVQQLKKSHRVINKRNQTCFIGLVQLQTLNIAKKVIDSLIYRECYFTSIFTAFAGSFCPDDSFALTGVTSCGVVKTAVMYR